MSVLTDHRVLLGGLDISGVGSHLQVQYRPVEAEGTTFGRGTRTVHTAGPMTKVTGEIFWDTKRPGVRAVRDILTLIPEHARVGEEGITIPKITGICRPQVHGITPSFDVDLEAVNSPLIRSVIMFQGFTNVAGHGQAFRLSSVTERQHLVSVCHLVELNASWVTLSLERFHFAGEYRPEVTHRFAHTNEIGAQWQELAGPLTESLWRVTWDTDGEFEAFHLVGLY